MNPFLLHSRQCTYSHIKFHRAQIFFLLTFYHSFLAHSNPKWDSIALSIPQTHLFSTMVFSVFIPYENHLFLMQSLFMMFLCVAVGKSEGTPGSCSCRRTPERVRENHGRRVKRGEKRFDGEHQGRMAMVETRFSGINGNNRDHDR